MSNRFRADADVGFPPYPDDEAAPNTPEATLLEVPEDYDAVKAIEGESAAKLEERRAAKAARYFADLGGARVAAVYEFRLQPQLLPNAAAEEVQPGSRFVVEQRNAAIRAHRLVYGSSPAALPDNTRASAFYTDNPVLAITQTVDWRLDSELKRGQVRQGITPAQAQTKLQALSSSVKGQHTSLQERARLEAKRRSDADKKSKRRAAADHVKSPAHVKGAPGVNAAKVRGSPVPRSASIADATSALQRDARRATARVAKEERSEAARKAARTRQLNAQRNRRVEYEGSDDETQSE